MKENINPNALNISPYVKDKTNGAQSSVAKTVATQQQTKVDGDPAATQRKEEDQYANPNKITTVDPLTVETAFAGMDQKDLKGFYGVKGPKYSEIPSSFATSKGVFEFKSEKVTIPEIQQVKIQEDRNNIDFGVKKAGSGVGLSVDFAMSFKDVQDLASLMEQNGRFTKLAKYPDGQRDFERFSLINSTIMDMAAQGIPKSDPRMQELVTQYKLQLNEIVVNDIKSIEWADEDAEWVSLLDAYRSYTEGTSKLAYAFSSDGSTLESKYKDLVSAQGMNITRKVFHDLDSIKDRKHYDTGSRTAKVTLLNNPYWQTQYQLAKESNPIMAEIMERESAKNYISEYEREMISSLNKQVGPQLRDQYERSVKILGRSEADAQFKDMNDLFNIFSNITYDKVSDDLKLDDELAQEVFAPANQLFYDEKYFAGENDSELYQKLLAEKTAKYQLEKDANDEAYRTVNASWLNADSSSNSGSSSLVSSLGGERIQRFASKVRT